MIDGYKVMLGILEKPQLKEKVKKMSWEGEVFFVITVLKVWPDLSIPKRQESVLDLSDLSLKQFFGCQSTHSPIPATLIAPYKPLLSFWKPRKHTEIRKGPATLHLV